MIYTRLMRMNAVKEFIGQFSATQWRFFICAMICSFFICADYALIRPVSNSVFITFFSAKAFPYAWLATVPLNLFAVAVYNRYLPRWGCAKMFIVTVSLLTAAN
ncbi:MAG: hypothetical protein ACM3JI_05450, partial [Anaerolineae bacterium]